MTVLIVLVWGCVGLAGSALADWHDNFGPWVVATEGEPWPMPKQRLLQSHHLLLHPSSFNIYLSQDCAVLFEARKRYNEIIQNEANLGVYRPSRDFRRWADNNDKQAARNDTASKGMLQRLHVTVIDSCQEPVQLHARMNESYQLSIREDVAELVAPTWRGALHGLETFSQLLVPTGRGTYLSVRLQEIHDEPLLSYRGLLLDTSRHWLPLSDIFTTIDAMSYNKLNVLHWHIVDDNSFPYQSLAFPELSEKGAWLPRMIYTPVDIRNVISYATYRGVRVVPEFDTPGHSRALGQSHPEFLTACYNESGKPSGKLGPINPSNPAIWPFLRTLLGEVMDLFVDSYVHMGGDEVPFDCWQSNPDVVAYMQANGMSRDFARLESAYISELLKIPASRNKSSIVWQEVFDNDKTGLPPDVAVHVWTGDWPAEMTAATRAGHPVILSACWYLDHVLGGGDWKKYYLCDPLGFQDSDQHRSLVLGGEACMWGEFVDSTNIHQRMWPRASAAAERLWSSTADSLSRAAQRLEEHACRMRKRRVPAQPPNGPHVCTT